jgi:chromate transporter
LRPSASIRSVARSAAAILATFRFKVGMIPTLAGCALAGVVLHGFGVVG